MRKSSAVVVQAGIDNDRLHRVSDPLLLRLLLLVIVVLTRRKLLVT